MSKKTEELIIEPLKSKTMDFCVIGISPLIFNSLTTHATEELLYPMPKNMKVKTGLKHDPLREFRESVHVMVDEDAPTHLALPGPAWKYSIMNAAVDVAGATKAQTGRICWVNGYQVPVFGIPQPFMKMVRQSGIARTPDIRTRAIAKEWAAIVSVTFVTDNINATGLANLLNAAGMLQGIGDWRTQKGGSFGMYRIAKPSDPDFKRIMKSGGKEAQIEALKSPKWYDVESQQMFDWFCDEANVRGDEVTIK